MKTIHFVFAFVCCTWATAQVEIDQSIVLTGADGNRLIHQLEAPVAGTDAVNKEYVDTAVSASGSAQKTMLSNESSTEMNFGNAMRYCRDLVEGGYEDWEMPTRIEVIKVYSRGMHPVTNPTSANTFWVYDVQGGTGYDTIYYVRLSDGYMTLAGLPGSRYVRCVR